MGLFNIYFRIFIVELRPHYWKLQRGAHLPIFSVFRCQVHRVQVRPQLEEALECSLRFWIEELDHVVGVHEATVVNIKTKPRCRRQIHSILDFVTGVTDRLIALFCHFLTQF